MIVVDSSALVAIVLGEPGSEELLGILTAQPVALSAGNLVEAAIVVEARQGMDAARDLDLLVDGAIDEVVPVDASLARSAVQAWRRFGKGRHPAGLNFGDCFAYATAKDLNVPLLFVGDDFAKTDITSAH